MLSLKEEVEQLKKEKNAVILAHYYVPDDVQEVADYIIKSGIKYIWNFAPTILSVPAGIHVWHENLIGSFLQFCAIENIL